MAAFNNNNDKNPFGDRASAGGWRPGSRGLPGFTPPAPSPTPSPSPSPAPPSSVPVIDTRAEADPFHRLHVLAAVAAAAAPAALVAPVAPATVTSSIPSRGVDELVVRPVAGTTFAKTKKNNMKLDSFARYGGIRTDDNLLYRGANGRVIRARVQISQGGHFVLWVPAGKGETGRVLLHPLRGATHFGGPQDIVAALRERFGADGVEPSPWNALWLERDGGVLGSLNDVRERLRLEGRTGVGVDKKKTGVKRKRREEDEDEDGNGDEGQGEGGSEEKGDEDWVPRSKKRKP